jgi:DNA (cytosine-5)-methyltransferase 1
VRLGVGDAFGPGSRASHRANLRCPAPPGFDPYRLRYLSVCSGIEAATVAWQPLGWKAAAFSEIEAFPRAVLTHHYPDTLLHGDFTTIGADDYGPIDLLVGGTPCQSFSVAGLRGGLGDDRGNLALEYLRLADRKRPRWLVWENVPGVLSSNGGRDFGSILGGLVELGYGFAYRVLDAQFFGVPQRRRRIFVVGHLGDWRCAAAVLFERHSLSGHPPPRRSSRQGASSPAARSVAIRGRDGTPQAELGDEVANALVTPNGGRGGIGVGAVLEPASFNWQASGKQTSLGWKPETGAVDTLHAGQVQAIALQSVNTPREKKQNGLGVSEDGAMYSLTARDEHAVCIHHDALARDGLSKAGGRDAGKGWIDDGTSYNLIATAPHAVSADSVLRRLTPRECERLQGFPDDYTLVPYRGKPAADGPRYKALGNSMAVPVMRWIGERITLVDAIATEAQRAETVQLGSVHEGAGRQASPRTWSS